MPKIATFKELYEKEKESNLNDYFTFLRFKSIATDPAFKDEVERCADWLAAYLKRCGLQVEKWDTGRVPTLFAHDLRAGPEKETLLLYCHYDVQPVDPLSEWITPPFEPQIRGGEVFDRRPEAQPGSRWGGHLGVNLGARSLPSRSSSSARAANPGTAG